MEMQLPNDVNSERGVLASLIFNEDVFEEVSQLLEPVDFFNKQNQDIFQTILSLRVEQRPVDAITIYNTLSKQNPSYKNKSIEDYINQIITDAPNLQSVFEYVESVKSTSTKRRALEILSESYKEVANCDDIESVTSSIIGKLEVAQKSSKQEENFFEFKKLYIARAELLDKKDRGEFVEDFIETGLTDLDSLLSGGLRFGHFDILAARPAMGKTSLACQFITHACMKNRIPCLMFSIEMSKEDIADKMISIISSVPYKKILKGDLDHNDWDKLTEASMFLGAEGSDLVIDDTTRDLNKMISAIRLAKRKFGIRFVVIDYLQLMIIPGKYNTRDEQLGYTVNSLAYVAKTLDINILSLSQINRGVESRTDRRPMLSDLRESGNIEQAAWRVLSIYRDEYYNPEGDEVGNAEIAVLKGKISNTGKVKVKFDKECTRFQNLEWARDSFEY